MEARPSTMTRIEAARRVGCSTWSIDRFIDQGRLRVVRIGVGRRRRHVRIVSASMESLLTGTGTAVHIQAVK